MLIDAREKAVSNPPTPDDFACRIAEHAAKTVGYSGYFNGSEVNEIVAKLEEKGFRPIQRPHCKLPALMTHWDSLLKKSGYPVIWLSKRVKGRRVVRAVVGAHFTDMYCIRLFGDFETKYYENHN